MTEQTTAVRRGGSRRYWRQRPEPLSLWPWPLLLLLGLLLVLLWGWFSTSNWIEDDVTTEVAERLAVFGITADDISADGQLLTIQAGSRTAAEAQRIQEIALATRCDTWAGDVICPRRVEVIAQGPEAPAVAQPVARPHRFSILADTGAVTLRGEVDSEGVREAIVTAAQERFDSVDDQLTVSSEAAEGNLVAAGQHAILTLAGVLRGSAEWQDGQLSINGLVAPDAESTVRDVFTNPGLAVPLGSLSLTAAKAVDRCDQEFAEALSASTINFATASAKIDASSTALLRTLAELANTCPGNLRIEGHTDSVGNADANQQLSEARAGSVREALVDLGVSSRRLTAVGFGESRPIASNDSAAGRAENRRIVIRIDAEGAAASGQS